MAESFKNGVPYLEGSGGLHLYGAIMYILTLMRATTVIRFAMELAGFEKVFIMTHTLQSHFQINAAHDAWVGSRLARSGGAFGGALSILLAAIAQSGAAQSRSPLIILERANSQMRAVSADGNVVAGTMRIRECGNAVRWTLDGGAVFLPVSPTTRCSAVSGLSADGSRAVGNIVGNIVGSGQPAAYWDATGLPVVLGDLSGGNLSATAECVSADGSIIMGAGRPSSGIETWRWTADLGMLSLGDLPGGSINTFPFAVSADGNVMMGVGFAESGAVMFRWTHETGFENLGPVPGSTGSGGFGMSSDGTTLVGCAATGSGQAEYAVLWRRESGYVALGQPAGSFRGLATCADRDGTNIGGRVLKIASNGRGIDHAVLWVEGRETRLFADVLRDDLGVDLGEFRPASISGISDDGTTVAGWGVMDQLSLSTFPNSFGFIAYLPRVCRVDLDNTGGVDGGDVEAFFTLWEDGLPQADFDRSGEVEGNDIAAFLSAWQVGC